MFIFTQSFVVNSVGEGAVFGLDPHVLNRAVELVAEQEAVELVDELL